MSDKLFKLPLFAKTQQLQSIPGEDARRVFMITEAIKPQPEKSMGYLVEQVSGRQVRIHAWLAIGGAIFTCDEPIEERPERNPDAGMSKDDDGDIFFFVRAEGRPVKAAHFTQREKDGRLTVSNCMNDLGPYGTGAHDIDVMGAACYLTQWMLPREHGESMPTLTVADILDTLLESSYPDALDALVYRGGKEDASGFERYASRSLAQAGAEFVRPIAATHDIDIRRLSSTGLFWTGCDKRELTDEQIDTIQAVEGALNRLVFAEHCLGEDSSPMVGGLTEGACERAALSSLHSFASVAERLMRGCDRKSDYMELAGAQASRGGEWDLRTRFAAAAEGLRAPFNFDYVFTCDAASGVFAIEATVPVAGAFPEWDLRTRFAAAAEGLRAPFNFDYVFTCDAASGVFAIEATVPVAGAFPFQSEAERNDARAAYSLRLAMTLAAFTCDAASGVFAIEATVPVAGAFPFQSEAERNDARAAYSLRLAMTLAATAFGAGVGVVRAVVTVRERNIDGDAIASLEFSRQMFTMQLMPALQSGAILDASLSLEELIEGLALRTLRMKMGELGALLPIEPIEASLPDRSIKMAEDMRPLPASLVEPLRARTLRMKMGELGALLPIEPIEASLPDRSIKMAEDMRPLPASLVEPLRADRVCDLDIFDTGDDPLRDRYREIGDRVREASAPEEEAPVASELADLIAAYDAAEMLEESAARPLYCVNMVSRIIVGEHDDGPQTRFRKIPDTMFDARSMLCRIYREQGNLEDAIRLGEELVRLAPTSFTAYHSLALALREADRMEDAVRALLEGLTVAADPTDIACAYYRLGFYFWQGGDPSLGLACYAMVKPGTYFYGEAQAEMQELMQQSHLSRRPDLDEARALLRADGVPVAPVPQLGEMAAKAGIALVDAGMFARRVSPWSTPACSTRRTRSCTSSRVWMSRPTASTCSPRSAAPSCNSPNWGQAQIESFRHGNAGRPDEGRPASCCWWA